MKKLTLAAIAAVSVSTTLGCRGQTSYDEPIFGIRNMYDQPKYDIQEESDFFPDRRTMRPLVEGVVAHGTETDPGVARGRLEDESGYVLEIPKTVVERAGGMQAMLVRGQARYGIYCTPCHDGTGTGEGLVKQRAVAAGAAAFAPPSFHQDRIRQMPDGQLFATIANGKSNMPAYAAMIPVDDRWSIVAYVRALQLAHPKLATQAAPAPTSMGDLGPAPGGTAAAAADAKNDAGAKTDSTQPTPTAADGGAHPENKP